MQTTVKPSKRLMTCTEVGEVLGVCSETVRKWFRNGVLTGVRLNNSAIRIHADSVEAMAEKGESHE